MYELSHYIVSPSMHNVLVVEPRTSQRETDLLSQGHTHVACALLNHSPYFRELAMIQGLSRGPSIGMILFALVNIGPHGFRKCHAK